MDHFAGMDVSVKETSVCILDDAGKIVKEVKVASEPQALRKVLGNPAYPSSGSDWKPGRCRNGYSALWPNRVTSDLCGDAAHAGRVEGDFLAPTAWKSLCLPSNSTSVFRAPLRKFEHKARRRRMRE
jgi:hypothetical protein